jgi:hypothetical protein
MAYFTLLTNIGQAKIANALALGQKISISTMKLGDGNGAPTTPSQGQTALVRTVYTGQLNQLAVDPENPNYVVAELVVPADQGGWTVREVGLFDDAGDMIAVGNFPETYKPVLSEGAARDMVVRIIIEVSNASAITLKIDPAVVLASRSWVSATFVTKDSVKGGTTGQALVKKSATDHDWQWQDIAAGLNFSGVNLLTQNTTLTASAAGALQVIQGLGGLTITLPAANGVKAGAAISFRSATQVGATNIILRGRTQDAIQTPGSSTASVTVRGGDTLVFVSDGQTNWHLSVDATADLIGRQFSYQQTLGTAGFQAIPNGPVIAWGEGQTNSAGVTTITFAAAFPRNCRQLVASPTNASGSAQSYIITTGPLSRTGCQVFATGATPGNVPVAASVGFRYVAFGD